MVRIYPTPEEILKEPGPYLDQGDIAIIKEWKQKYYFSMWSHLNFYQKNAALTELLDDLAMNHKDEIRFIVTGEEYSYDLQEKRLTLSNTKPSIISALHELGHHLWGSSELEACRWSVWLFKTTFPTAYSKLYFKGHLLTA